MPLDLDRWAKVQEVFGRVVALPSSTHAFAALPDLAGGDPALIEYLEPLVKAHYGFARAPLAGSNAVLDSPTPPAAPVVEAPHLSSRFRVLGRLGRGSFGEVFHVFDEQRRMEVALKALHSPQGAARYYFKREFRKLRDVRHPNIVVLREGFFGDEPWHFTMEIVRGTDILTALRDTPAAGWEPRLRQMLRQLAEGVHALHRHLLLHRDVKPSHVLVTPDDRVVLIDFGLVRDVVDMSAPGTIAGTPPYMSPEQVSGRPLAEASDWYAAGVVLYQALTGSLPPRGEVVGFGRPSTETLRAPHELNPRAPQDLSDLCLGLLAVDPGRRAGFDDVMRVVQSAPAVWPARPADTELVGRDQPLSELWAAFERSGDRSAVAHVCGPSGIGKTTLVREFLSQVSARAPDALIFTGRCFQGESVPFQTLDDLVDQLSQHLKRLPRDRLDAILPRNFPALVRMFPVLEQLPVAPHRPPAIDAAELRRHGFAALSEMLDRLAERHRLVLAIDDLQWGDGDGCAFLRQLTQSSPGSSLFLLLSYRSEDLEAIPWLRDLRDRGAMPSPAAHVLVDLQELKRAEANLLAERLLRARLPYGATDPARVAEIAGGNPFLVHAVAEWVSARGVTTDLTADEIVLARAEALPAAARRLLQVVAVAGQPLPIEVAQAAGELTDVVGSRDELVRERLVRLRVVEGRQEIEVYHDRIRRAVLARLDDAGLADLHRRLARGFRAEGVDDPERIAEHMERGGLPGFAADALRAAGRAFEALAFDRAAALYERALRGDLQGTGRLEASRRLGDAFANGGRGADAAAAYLEAAILATGHEHVRLRAQAASQLLRCGHADDGMALLSALLRERGLRPARTRVMAMVSIAAQRTRLRASRLLHRAETDLASGAPLRREIDPDVQLRLDLAWSGVLGLALLDPLRSAEFSARHLWHALRARSAYHASLGLAAEAVMQALTASDARDPLSARMLTTARVLADRLDSPHATGVCLMVSGVLAYLQGRWKEASERCDEAETLLRTQCTNVAWELSLCTVVATIGRQASGEWRTVRERLPGFIRDAEARGDLNASLTLRLLSLAYVMDVVEDQPDRALAQLQHDLDLQPSGPYALPRANSLQAEVDLALYLGRPRAAWKAVQERWKALERSQTLRLPVTFAFSMYTRGRAALGLAADGSVTREERARLLEDARRSAAAMERKGPSFSRGLAGLLRAGLATFANSDEAVLHELTTAAARLADADMVPFRMAALARRRGYVHDAAAIEAIERWRASQGVVRFDVVVATLAPGRFREDAHQGR